MLGIPPAGETDAPARAGRPAGEIDALAQPAFGCYVRDQRTPILHAHGPAVLTLDGDRISALTRFTGDALLTTFGLPRSLRT